MRLSKSQKWGLSAVFSVSGITILTAIVRATQVSDVTHPDVVWLTLWGVIESSTGQCSFFPLVMFLNLTRPSSNHRRLPP